MVSGHEQLDVDIFLEKVHSGELSIPVHNTSVQYSFLCSMMLNPPTIEEFREYKNQHSLQKFIDSAMSGISFLDDKISHCTSSDELSRLRRQRDKLERNVVSYIHQSTKTDASILSRKQPHKIEVLHKKPNPNTVLEAMRNITPKDDVL